MVTNKQVEGNFHDSMNTIILNVLILTAVFKIPHCKYNSNQNKEYNRIHEIHFCTS